MKKPIAILTALFILIAGMRLSMATHVCGGEVAAVKWSFSGETASCGMETDCNDGTTTRIATDCCHDHIASFSVDNQYKTPSVQIVHPAGGYADISLFPVSYLRFSAELFSTLAEYTSPPDTGPIDDVDLARICTLRI